MKLKRVKPDEQKIRSALLGDLKATLQKASHKVLGDQIGKLRGVKPDSVTVEAVEVKPFAKGGKAEDRDDSKEVGGLDEDREVNPFMREAESDGPSDADATESLGDNTDPEGDEDVETDEDADEEAAAEDAEESIEDLIRKLSRKAR